MGLFDFLRGPDLQAGLQAYRATPGALLLDVRTEGEYRGGHIPGSRNLPLAALGGAAAVAPGKDTPLFVYCFSGARSRQAVSGLKHMGYTHVTDLGGINRYHGRMER